MSSALIVSSYDDWPRLVDEQTLRCLGLHDGSAHGGGDDDGMLNSYQARDVQTLALIKCTHTELEARRRRCACGWMQDSGIRGIGSRRVRSTYCFSFPIKG